MNRLLFVVALLVLLVVPASRPRAQESLSLTAPVAQSIATITVRRVVIDVLNSAIFVEFSDNLGNVQTKRYDATTSPTGATLLHTLNTANFTTNSLIKQVYARLTADGVVGAGTVVGTAR